MNIDCVVDCIDKVNVEFVRGTWNFNHERNFQCLLFGYLRESDNQSRIEIKQDGEIKTVELVHAEFNSPSAPDTNNYLDIAIMEKKSASSFSERYDGRPERERNRDLSLKAAIEIKVLYGPLSQQKMEDYQDDLKKLKMLLKPRKKLSKRCYFLLYIDVDNNGWIINEQIVNICKEDNWRKLLQTFKKASKGHKEFEVCCVFGKQNLQCWFSDGKPTWEIVDSSLN
ncbi:hypothetical protein ES707_03226 [subsurface metagenome]